MIAQSDRLIDYVTEKLPTVAEHLAEARKELLAFTGNTEGRVDVNLVQHPC